MSNRRVSSFKVGEVGKIGDKPMNRLLNRVLYIFSTHVMYIIVPNILVMTRTNSIEILDPFHEINKQKDLRCIIKIKNS